jgi:cellulose 1,4-beta-cellobiosidase
MKLNLLRGGRHPRLRRALAASAALLAGGGMVVVAATQASAATGCRVTYTVNQWNTGFTANLTVTNLGDPISSWDLRWTFAGNQQITQSWSSKFSQSGAQVSLTNEAWNGSLGTNASTNPGFNANYSGTNAIPTSFTLNGTACTGSVTGGPSTGPSSASPTRSNSPTTSISPTRSVSPTTSTSPPPVGTHLDNPYVGARPYVNPDWAANANSVSGGSRVANQPTFVWLDRIAAIAGTSSSRGLRAHLDTALQQGANMFQFVVYDLPGRDCSALASNGELGPTEIGRYQTEYIDPIAAILADPAYRSLRIVAIIEIDSLPNLVTNVSGNTAKPVCQTMQQNGNYVTGIRYALSKLHAIPNVYNYVDAAHHGWLGWDSNFGPAADLFASTAAGATGGCNTVDGFIANTANYSALTEPNFTINSSFNGVSVRQSKWVDFNQYVDELTYTQAFRNALASRCFGQNTNPIGMLIDTSRNGWGGSARPSGPPASAANIDEWVNGAKIDRRIHAGNWCNQSGAGLGERPRAAPASGIDAYVWVKPPGESDGASQPIDNNEGKGFDQMCDPNYTGNVLNGNNRTGALANAPLSGHWFPAQFQQLMQNAFPPL